MSGPERPRQSPAASRGSARSPDRPRRSRAAAAAGRAPRAPVASRRRRRWVAGLTGAAVALVAVLWLLRIGVPEDFAPEPAQSAALEHMEQVARVLYFSSPDGRGLVAETRFLPRPEGTETDIRAVIDALIAGPQCGATSAWPPDVALQDLFLGPDGTAYANFGASLHWLLPAGDACEWAVVASLTRTLCENFPRIRGVRMQIDGQDEGALRRMMPLEWVYRPSMFREGR
jgi:hypothetical protein